MSYLPLRRTWMWEVRKMQEHIIRRRTWKWEVWKTQERFSTEYKDVGNAGISKVNICLLGQWLNW